jgi:hypothetical protein
MLAGTPSDEVGNEAGGAGDESPPSLHQRFENKQEQ